MKTKKIGVCLTTFNRPELYKKVLSSIPLHKIDCFVIVNDGVNSYVKDTDASIVIKNGKTLGVGKSKNIGLKKLIEDQECTDIFLIEDDILIKNDLVFEAYINAANTHGVHHLCYELAEDNHKYLKHTNTIKGITLNYYHNPQGPFMYINSVLIKKFGYIDENYINAFEHIDFAYNLIKQGVAPPFWYFPDISNSNDYLEYLDVEQKSTIRNEKIYSQQYQTSAQHFVKKWGHFTNQIPDVGKAVAQQKINNLYFNYSRDLTKCLTDFFDISYCINLDRRKDRWDECEKIFNSYKLKIKRYAAEDGKNLPASKISSGALGLIHTNINILTEAKINNFKSILIVEDDVKFYNSISRIEKYFEFLPDDWDMIYFGGNHNLHMGEAYPAVINEHVLKLHHTYTTHCIGIKNSAYDIILQSLESKDKPLDVVYASLQKKLNVYCFTPIVASQREGYSDIEMKHINYDWLIK